jgi:hypothetical protein
MGCRDVEEWWAQPEGETLVTAASSYEPPTDAYAQKDEFPRPSDEDKDIGAPLEPVTVENIIASASKSPKCTIDTSERSQGNAEIAQTHQDQQKDRQEQRTRSTDVRLPPSNSWPGRRSYN